MLILANILSAIAYLLNTILFFLIILVVARAVISWVSPDPFNPIVRFLTQATDPMLFWLRRYVPLVGGRVDITPIILLLILSFLRIALVRTIADYAELLRRSAMLP
jgi:YggT family protein